VASTLHQANCLKSWRNELLAVFSGERHHALGAIERAAVRTLGLLTKAVHLNAWTPNGQLWIARRSLTKSTDPGMWDTLAGGLISAGQDAEQALLRESFEEAGLAPRQLAQRSAMRHVQRICRRLPEGYQIEDVLASSCVLAAGVQPVNVDGEVMEIVTASVPEVLEKIVAGQFTLEAALVLLEDITRRHTGRAL
jgi:8-oxo-dGTP pyrophosphatase MutT (NUDIX family)